MSLPSSKIQVEKLPDLLLGLSLLAWALAGTWSALLEGQSISIVRISLSVLQASVGLLLFFRPMPHKPGTWPDFLFSLPSFLTSGLLFKLAHPRQAWPLSSEILFALAVGWVLLCFWHLRKSFAIFPAQRKLVTSGPYRLLRHPAYLGEGLMGFACAWAVPTVWTWLLAMLIFPLLLLRIQREEACMAADPAFMTYKGQTKYRLLPFLW